MTLRPTLLLPALAVWLVSVPAMAQLTVLPEPPANQKPGECYGLVYVPAQFRTVEERQLLAPASERVETLPAVYELVEEQVTLPATQRRRVITPAVTETVEETVLVAGQQRRVAVPARYKTVEQQVTVAAGAQLKPGKLLDGSEGAAICIVDGATSTKTVRTQVLERPASTRLVTTAPREKVVQRKKIITPAVTEWVPVPERTVTRQVKKLVTPASARSVPVPARYETVQRQEITTPARAEWQPVLCETNLTPALVQGLQEALKAQGLYTGAANGRLTAQTETALRRYQQREQLPTGGLSLATLDKLGVSVTTGQVLAPRPSALAP